MTATSFTRPQRRIAPFAPCRGSGGNDNGEPSVTDFVEPKNIFGADTDAFPTGNALRRLKDKISISQLQSISRAHGRACLTTRAAILRTNLRQSRQSSCFKEPAARTLTRGAIGVGIKHAAAAETG